MNWMARIYLFASGLLMMIVAWAQLSAGHIVFDTTNYRQTTFAAGGYGIGALLMLLAFLPPKRWFYKHITTPRKTVKRGKITISR